MNPDNLNNILEAALFAAGGALSVAQLQDLFPESERPETAQIKDALKSIQADFESRGIVLIEVSSGYRFQTASDVSEWVSRLWEERPPKYSRALLETLALIAYRQPVTRGEIEDVRGVSVSSNIVKTLLERQWVRVVGHRDVPGRPAMYGTTKEFLDYFSLKSLDELPPLSELKDIDALTGELDLQLPDENKTTQAEPAKANSDDTIVPEAQDEMPESESQDEQSAEPDSETESHS